MNGLHDLLATIKKIEEDNSTTYVPKDYQTGEPLTKGTDGKWRNSKGEERDGLHGGPVNNDGSAQFRGIKVNKPASAAPASAAPASAAPASAAPQSANPEVQKKLDRIKQIISPTAENVIFKSAIGKSLLESFDLELNEATSPREELDQLWSELQQGVQSGVITGPEVAEIEKLAPDVLKFQQANPLSATQTAPANGGLNATNNAAPAPAAPAQSADVQKLAKDSGIADPNKLKIGQIVKTPNGDYTVVQGDTLWGISKGQFKGTPPKGVTPPANFGPSAADATKKTPPDLTKTTPKVDQKAAPIPTEPSKYTYQKVSAAPVIGQSMGQRWGNKIATQADVDQWNKNFGTDHNPDGTPTGGQKVEPQPAPVGRSGGIARAEWNQKYGKDYNPDGTPKAKVAESGFSSDELNRIVSLVHHR